MRELRNDYSRVKMITTAFSTILMMTTFMAQYAMLTFFGPYGICFIKNNYLDINCDPTLS